METFDEFAHFIFSMSTFSPAYKVVSWIGNSPVQEIIVDLGSEINIADELTAKDICETSHIELMTNCNEKVLGPFES